MIGNIWLSSALAVVAIFSASVAYKSYNDLQEAKQIQENYEIITKIKTQIAKQYDISLDDVSRDDIISHLPKDGNWEKILLLDRNENSTLSNDELVNSDGNIVINEDERLKLLALRAKLKKFGNESSISKVDDTFVFKVGDEKRNLSYHDNIIEQGIVSTLEDYRFSIVGSELIFNESIENNIPYESIYQIVLKDGESEDDFKERKREYFKSRIKQSLLENKTASDMELYNRVKDF